MKKILLLATCALFSNSLFSQQWDGPSTTTDHIFRNGNVSLGTNQNVDKLNLFGSLRLIQGDIAFGYNPPLGGHHSFNPDSNYRIAFMPAESGSNPFDPTATYSLPAALYF